MRRRPFLRTLPHRNFPSLFAAQRMPLINKLVKFHIRTGINSTNLLALLTHVALEVFHLHLDFSVVPFSLCPSLLPEKREKNEDGAQCRQCCDHLEKNFSRIFTVRLKKPLTRTQRRRVAIGSTYSINPNSVRSRPTVTDTKGSPPAIELPAKIG